MGRLLFVVFGSLFLVLGFIGVIVPGLPTTPFLLLSAACYVRSSKRLHSWLLNHKIFGKFIRDFQEKRSVSIKSKVISLLIMWLMISLSVFVFIDNFYVKGGIVVLGIAGTAVVLLIGIRRKC